jgi:hypothetical protein
MAKKYTNRQLVELRSMANTILARIEGCDGSDDPELLELIAVQSAALARFARTEAKKMRERINFGNR